ncbi:MAG: hypothetical protein IPO27_11910 [Bacteroidetes bacterium]|nr:hypothetical protein [Bacteroidota bacterium]
MFDSLLNLVKEHAGDAIVNNPAIPNEHNDSAIETATSGIMEGLKGAIGGGDLSSITSLFSGGGSSAGSNPIVNAISGTVANNLMQKFGINNSAASGIVTALIPTVMSKLVDKTNDPKDNSFDIGGIVSSLGGNASGLSGMLGNITSLFGK